ncbi:MAG: nucleotidyl transferase AbiEii/AbiGii toxin family protein [Candidatus Omnitrophota bacterium]|nr:nucleotidyl transferase AbiEii/AbiGii toxin family protein [Candidatus Omnitrophota bacterium]
MINSQEIKNLVTEWGLRDDVIEKDYVIGWLLWGIGSDPDLSAHWAFKGGTSLKKCYVETWRFSEDLDFTVIPGGPDKPETIEPIIKRVLERIHDESGIDFSLKVPVFKHADKYLYTEGRVYYRGPRNAPSAASIKLDISGSEKIARPTELKDISHSYSDELPKPARVRCYAFEEVFAEKIRAMGERGRPRDLYDIVLLFRRRDLQSAPSAIKGVLEEKCRSKNVPYPTLNSIQSAQSKAELISEWENMLGHQLQALPPFEDFWDELPNIFSWLEGAAEPAELSSIGADKGEDLTWTPPPTIWQWGLGVPLESIRFAAINHLCVGLGYQRSVRIIEPYSLRRTKDGNLILHAIKAGTGDARSYRVDRIESIKVTNKPFTPKYKIEFSSSGSISAPPTARKSDFDSSYSSGFSTPRRSRPRKTTSSFGMKYVFQCGLCGKKFTRSKYNSTLNKHKNTYGMNCSGRTGFFVGNK